MFLTNSQLPILLCVSSLKPCVYMRVDIISLTVCALRGGLLMHTWRGAGESPHTKNRPRPDHNAPFPHLTTLTSHNMQHAPPPPPLPPPPLFFTAWACRSIIITPHTHTSPPPPSSLPVSNVGKVLRNVRRSSQRPLQRTQHSRAMSFGDVLRQAGVPFCAPPLPPHRSSQIQAHT